MTTPSADRAPLLVAPRLATQLLDCYTYTDPRNPRRIIRGYDRPHALRTARLCAAVALRLGYTPARAAQYQTACLLHDLGRAGLDRALFGAIWTWARRQGIPTRPGEWRAAFPRTTAGRETEAFVARYGAALEAAGITMDAWAVEQVEMRLGYARRLARQARRVRPRLAALHVQWEPWMQRIMLYYYYPEALVGVVPWVRQLAEILVACEQFEAYSNQQRGRDYYARSRESLTEAFAYLESLRRNGILSGPVLDAVRELFHEGAFDRVIAEARGRAVTTGERRAVERAGADKVLLQGVR
ncbi:MAG: HD domain-containing protein [Nitrospiraceae bacterium]